VLLRCARIADTSFADASALMVMGRAPVDGISITPAMTAWFVLVRHINTDESALAHLEQ
jgi:hypothetical protein